MDAAQMKKLVEQYEAWWDQWPAACPRCGGEGELFWTENGAPHGAGFWPMDVSEVCECVASGHCARCGGHVPEWEEEDAEGNYPETPCPHCGWNWGEGDEDACPSVPDEYDPGV